jgi:hypothetical protein
MESAQYRRLDAMRPEIVGYDLGRYNLAADLKSLVRVHEAGAAEGAVFYSGRMLEVLAATALRSVGLLAGSIVISNLEMLQQFNLYPTATRYWAHALRRMANDVRHVLRPVSETDADLAMIFAERWLAWFFCEFAAGPKLAGLTTDGEPLFFVANPAVVESMTRCERGEVDADDPPIGLSPAIAALAAEILIERREHDAAERVLHHAVDQFGGDIRLRQLDGLLLSRTGKLEAALRLLEPLYAKFRDDPETAGILAGVYKRMGASGAAKAYEVYRSAWERMGNSSAYLGINAATMALLLARQDESRETAQEVKRLIEGRVKVVEKHLPDAARRMDFWDRVTLAEAVLLLEEFRAARDGYRGAFDDQASRRDDIEVARGQGRKILEALGKAHEVEHVFG